MVLQRLSMLLVPNRGPGTMVFAPWIRGREWKRGMCPWHPGAEGKMEVAEIRRAAWYAGCVGAREEGRGDS